MLLPDLSAASAGTAEWKEHLKKGKKALDEGRYEEAVRNLTVAGKDPAILGDYVLLYLSEAFHKLGDHRKSLDTVRGLFEKYPLSPLTKKARLDEISEAKECSGENAGKLYEAYVKDYPEDDEAGLAYGLFLKRNGDTEKATAVFKRIYLKAGPFSASAFAELAPRCITAGDLLERAGNLIKRYDFKDAEHDLRKALSMDGGDDGKKREEILKNLAYALFRQKQYREAASLYDMANDLYFKARSLYRAGDRQGFDKTLQDLLSKNDKRAGYLLSAVAADRRREKDFEGALKIYDEMLGRCPSDAEEAMWGTGWTHYLASEYKKASEIFSGMYAKYADPKYRYWQARSLEALGEDPKELYASLVKEGNNFYGGLAYYRQKEKPGLKVLSSFTTVDIPPEARDRFERVEALLSLDMQREAVFELIWISKKMDTPSALLYATSKFQELGEYKRAIGLATKIPYSEKMHRFWYPLAFWDEVEKISKRNGLDPLIALSVMREESRFDADARSVAGARGLMQIMPQTAYRLDKSLKLGIDRESQINDVRNNISLGAYYLKSLLSEFGSLARVLAAYNAGEAAVKKWEQRGNYKSADEFIEDIPYAETRNYVKKVLTSYFQYKKASGSPSEEAGPDIMLGRL